MISLFVIFLSDLFVNVVIIHIDDETKGVESFKQLLKRLSAEMKHSDVIIRLFKEVFPKDPFGSVVEIETVLKKCNYVLVFISKNFNEIKKRRFGLNACLIQNLLEKQKNNENIKIVSNCGNWDLPHDGPLTVTPESVFLDYFHYKVPDDIVNNKFKETFKNLLKCIDNA